MNPADRLAMIRENMDASRRTGRPPYIANDSADWLFAEVERLRGLLARLEWAGGTFCDEDACPACYAVHEAEPHEPDCWLAAELAGQDEPDPQRHRPERA